MKKILLISLLAITIISFIALSQSNKNVNSVEDSIQYVYQGKTISNDQELILKTNTPEKTINLALTAVQNDDFNTFAKITTADTFLNKPVEFVRLQKLKFNQLKKIISYNIKISVDSKTGGNEWFGNLISLNLLTNEEVIIPLQVSLNYLNNNPNIKYYKLQVSEI